MTNCVLCISFASLAVKKINKVIKESASQSPRKPLRHPGRGDGVANRIRNAPPRCAVDDWAGICRMFSVRRGRYSEIRNRDNPFGKHGTLPSNTPRRTGCCAPPKAILQRPDKMCQILFFRQFQFFLYAVSADYHRTVGDV